jgi:phosphatidylserine/phosphatidylglycerophosphate/cardiolipin synthase-like enzyme
MTLAVPPGCSSVPLPVLVQLCEAIEQGRLDCPPTETGLHAGGFGALSRPIAEALDGLASAAAVRALRLLIAERVHRPPPRLSLVWTGPEPRASVSRDTAMTVRDLFASARRSVLVGGYAFDKPEILAPLHAAMVSRGVTALLFMDIPGSATSAEGAEALATAAVDDFFRTVWTFGAPKPDVYHDPRTPLLGPPWASLHAKCIVVDDERALVTSANFTDRGQTRNIEAGVLIEDRGFAEELGTQWRAPDHGRPLAPIRRLSLAETGAPASADTPR